MANDSEKVYQISETGKYIIDRDKFYLTMIAKEWNEDAKDVLNKFMHNDINIFCNFEKHVLKMQIDCNNFAALPLNRDILYLIYSKGSWTGDTFKMPLERREPFNDEIIDAYGDVDFNSEITIGIEDLFVFEQNLIDFENRNPDIFGTKLEMSDREESSLYALIGVFLDMLVDKKDKNLLPNPNDGKQYPFQSQAELITYVENYDIWGLKKSSLEAKFAKANAVLDEKK